jgi:cell division protein FtsW (lipid II flippase)
MENALTSSKMWKFASANSFAHSLSMKIPTVMRRSPFQGHVTLKDIKLLLARDLSSITLSVTSRLGAFVNQERNPSENSYAISTSMHAIRHLTLGASFLAALE